ncbi:hypothetical protein [Natronorubrum daqingense]|nr:hypothetical protein [Natronorubrum daqingense]
MSSNSGQNEMIPHAAIVSLLVIFGFVVGMGFEMLGVIIQVFGVVLGLFSVYLLYRITVAVEHIADNS